MKNYSLMTRCLSCGGDKIVPFLDLGQQPLANSYHTHQDEAQESYPLVVNVCTNCFHSQLSVAVNPDSLFRNYIYVSGTTSTLMSHFQWFTEWTENQFMHSSLNVLDIACNDGSLLQCFAKRGHNVIGVDPAQNLIPIAKKNGVFVINSYWNMETAEKLSQKFDVVVAMNVLAHISNPLEFLKACKRSLAEGGKIFIQTSQAEMIPQGEFDTVYHEHHSFFNTNSLIKLAERAGLVVGEARTVPIHGNSYLWTLLSPPSSQGESVNRMLAREENLGYYRMSTYQQFTQKVNSIAKNVTCTINKYRSNNYKVIGYGAAAKGNTFLNFAELNLDYIIDDNPLKLGQFTPGRNIPIRGGDVLTQEEQNLVVLILAWNFKEEILSRIKSIRNNPQDVFISYYPEFEVCS